MLSVLFSHDVFRVAAFGITMLAMFPITRPTRNVPVLIRGATLLLCLLVGCGKTPPPMPVVVEEPRRASPPPKPPPPPPPPPSPLEGADPGDVFDEAESPPNFEVVGRHESDPQDQFAALIPERGTDHFEVVAGSGTAPRNGAGSTARLPSGFHPAEGTAYSNDGWPLRIVGEKDSAEMAYVPASTMSIGSNDGSPETRPEVSIEVSAFYVDVTEVTLGQFHQFRGAAGPKIMTPLNAADSARRPALGVNWQDAREYAHWAGKELPTEAEWELAARGPNAWRTPWGDGRALWERTRSPGQIDDVRSFQHDRSRFGLFDVAGNAREWCADQYSPKSFADAAALSPVKRRDWPGPKAPSRPNQRVVKGGSPDWSLWHRAGLEMRERAPDVGFRCVLRSKLEGTKPKL